MAATFVTPFSPSLKPHGRTTGVFHPLLLQFYTLLSKPSLTARVTSPPQPFTLVGSAIQYHLIKFPYKIDKIYLKNFFPWIIKLNWFSSRSQCKGNTRLRSHGQRGEESNSLPWWQGATTIQAVCKTICSAGDISRCSTLFMCVYICTFFSKKKKKFALIPVSILNLQKKHSTL